MSGPGAARLDGLLKISFDPDPAAEGRASTILDRLETAVPVEIGVQRDPGFLTLMPESETFRFDPESRPTEVLLPVLRELVAALGSGARAESTFRVQEFLGDTVREGVFVFENGELSLTAREREARPEERPTLPEPSLSDRAESLLRRHRWALAALAALVLAVGWFGWSRGWWTPGASLTRGPAIDAGPLADVVEVTRVRAARDTLLVELLPGSEFARFPEVAESCSLRPGLFRVLLEKDGELLPGLLVLDLRKLPGRMAEREDGEPLLVRVPSRTSRFDRLLICR